MSTYNKNLYTSTNSAIDAGIIYDQTAGKMQNEINAETVPVERGGTGATSVIDARTNLGLTAKRAPDNTIVNKSTNYGSRISYCASNVIEMYLTNLNTGITSGSTIGTLSEGWRPSANFAVLTVYSNLSPYKPIGSLWISNAGVMTIYFEGTSPGYVFGTYIANAS